MQGSMFLWTDSASPIVDGSAVCLKSRTQCCTLFFAWTSTVLAAVQSARFAEALVRFGVLRLADVRAVSASRRRL